MSPRGKRRPSLPLFYLETKSVRIWVKNAALVMGATGVLGARRAAGRTFKYIGYERRCAVAKRDDLKAYQRSDAKRNTL
jgi:hypothetical protein